MCITFGSTDSILAKIKNEKKMPFVDVDICHRIATSRKLYSVTLTYFLKIKKYEMLISESVRASTQMHEMTYVDFDFAIKKHLQNCTP